MRFVSAVLLSALVLLPSAAFAQTWEIGGTAGSGFFNHLPVSSQFGSATAGFANGPVYGGFIGHNMYRLFSGEFHYDFSNRDLKVGASGSDVRFKAKAHSIHYDFLIHAAPVRARARPFLAVGGGMKMYRGTGAESAYQPLQQYAILTRTQETKPLLSVGGGLKIRLSERVALRMEFRDQITPFPKNVIAPAPGASIGGWIHDLIPVFGVSFLL